MENAIALVNILTAGAEEVKSYFFDNTRDLELVCVHVHALPNGRGWEADFDFIDTSGYEPAYFTEGVGPMCLKEILKEIWKKA